MARISGVNIPLNKRVEIGLTYIYGVGRPTSNRLLAELGISPDKPAKQAKFDEKYGLGFPLLIAPAYALSHGVVQSVARAELDSEDWLRLAAISAASRRSAR